MIDVMFGPVRFDFRVVITNIQHHLVVLKTMFVCVLGPPPPGGPGGGSGLSVSEIEGFGPIPARTRGVLYF